MLGIGPEQVNEIIKKFHVMWKTKKPKPTHNI